MDFGWIFSKIDWDKDWQSFTFMHFRQFYQPKRYFEQNEGEDFSFIHFLRRQ